MPFRGGNKSKKKERKNSLGYLNKRKHLVEKASQTVFCFVKRGSLTAEAAGVLPVFLFGMIAVFTLMNLWTIKTSQLISVCEEAKEKALLFVGENSEEEITVSQTSVYHPISVGFALFDIPISTSITVHSWNGAEDFGAGNTDAEEMVIVTVYGSVYHRDINCSYIDLSIREAAGSEIANLRNKYGERYRACETCSYHQSPASIVRITESGNRYHNNGSCSDLKRTLQLVPVTEVSGMHQCSRCGGA